MQEEAAGKKDHKQRAAECLLCIMSLLSALLSRLEHVDKYECCCTSAAVTVGSAAAAPALVFHLGSCIVKRLCCQPQEHL